MKKNFRSIVIGLIIITLGLLMTACSSEQEVINYTNEQSNQDSSDNKGEDVDSKENEETKDNTQEEKEVKEEEKEINYQEVKPYEIGHIMIVMYHGILDNPPYHRTEENFKKDLQYMYDHGYRLISMRDYIDNNITVEAGYTPIVLTFDDGLSSTFSLVEEDGKLVPAEGTAIAILEEFAKENPDFGKTATLYINGDNDPFKGKGEIADRLKWLVDNGYELGNHTQSHYKLNKLSSEKLQEEIGKVDQLIKNAIPNYTVDSLTYPHGIRPLDHLDILENGEYNGVKYNIKMGIREGASGLMVSPLHKKFDHLNVPRVRGSEGAVQDLWWFFNYYDNENPDYKYISDGNPDRVALPSKYEGNVNKEKLGDKELFLYELEN